MKEASTPRLALDGALPTGQAEKALDQGDSTEAVVQGFSVKHNLGTTKRGNLASIMKVTESKPNDWEKAPQTVVHEKHPSLRRNADQLNSKVCSKKSSATNSRAALKALKNGADVDYPYEQSISPLSQVEDNLEAAMNARGGTTDAAKEEAPFGKMVKIQAEELVSESWKRGEVHDEVLPLKWTHVRSSGERRDRSSRQSRGMRRSLVRSSTAEEQLGEVAQMQEDGDEIRIVGDGEQAEEVRDQRLGVRKYVSITEVGEKPRDSNELTTKENGLKSGQRPLNNLEKYKQRRSICKQTSDDLKRSTSKESRRKLQAILRQSPSHDLTKGGEFLATPPTALVKNVDIIIDKADHAPEQAVLVENLQTTKKKSIVWDFDKILERETPKPVPRKIIRFKDL